MNRFQRIFPGGDELLAPRDLPAPSISDVGLLERTCRAAMFGVSKIVSAHVILAGLLVIVALILYLGENQAMAHVMVNFGATLLFIGVLVVMLDMSNKGRRGYFKVERMFVAAILLSLALVVAGGLMHNVGEGAIPWWASLLVVSLGVGLIAYVRFGGGVRVDEQYISMKDSLPGYVRPYREFIRRLDAEVDNAIFSGKGRAAIQDEAARGQVDDAYAAAKASFGQVISRRFEEAAAADEAVKDYLARANQLMTALGAKGGAVSTGASSAALAQLASRNLATLVRM
jgi:hypothetical protein